MMRVYGNGERRKDDAAPKCRRLTKRALDRWDSSPFSGISRSVASSFLCSQALSTPAHLPVTQTVRRHVSDITMDSDSISASRRSRWITKPDTFLVQAGFVLFTLALLTGFVIARLLNQKMALSAHVTGILNALVLIVLGLAWGLLAVSPLQTNLTRGAFL